MPHPLSRLGPVLSAAAALTLLLTAASAARAEDPSELIFVFQKQKDPAEVQRDADRLASLLSDELDLPVRAVVPGDYTATVRALIGKKADVAYVSSLPFLLARRDGDAVLLLAEQRPDVRDGQLRTEYDSILVTRRDSGLDSIDDIKRQAGELRMAFTSPTSTSGYVFAVLRFVREGMMETRQDPRRVFDQVMYGGSYTGALRAVADGRADVAAVSYYTMEGTGSENYLDSESRDKLQIVARTPGVPTHLVCARGELSEDLRDRIKQALLKIGNERPELLKDVYGANSLVEVDEDEHVKATAEAATVLPGRWEDLAQ